VGYRPAPPTGGRHQIPRGTILKYAVLAGAVGALLAFAAPAAAEDLTFTLTNDSSWIVSEFYASPADVNDWEEDILGVDVLGAGEATDVTIGDGRTQCVYDFKFVLEDGTEHTAPAVNICELGSYTLHD
jgi:hypothetical protein